MENIFPCSPTLTWRKAFIAVPLIGFAFLFLSMFRVIPLPLGNILFGYVHEASFICLGGYFFLWGFHELRKKRLIENTPRSTARSVAMGFAEITGCARQKYPLKSPLTGADCTYYRFLIEKEVRDGKGNRHWRKVKEGNSTNYFYVEDATGRLLVDPLDAEPFLVKDYQKIEDGTGLLGSGRMRYTEWKIEPGAYVYALGTVKKFRDAAAGRTEKLCARLRELKADKERLMQAADADKDGQISPEEWDAVRARVEQEMLEEELRTPPTGDEIVLGKGQAEDTFILSDRDERDVARSLAWRSGGATFGGFLVVVIMLFSLVSRAGLLPHGFVIPWHAFYH